MARVLHFSSLWVLRALLLTVLFDAPIMASAAQAHQNGRRDILSDIGNFFDGIEMQVDMDIFQPIENFFSTVASDINQYIVMPADQFFMQANTVIVSALYGSVMLAEDIGKAIESAVIDEVVSVENLAVQVGKDVTQDLNVAFANVKNEFDNVITPALVDAGKQVGAAFATAGTEIIDGLNTAGDYIDAHPELIAEVLLSAVLIGLTVVQPELVAADGALIGEIAVEAASETAVEVAGEIGADAAVEGAADVIVEGAAEEVLDAADEPVMSAIGAYLEANPDEEEAYNTVEEVLDMISDNGETDTEKFFNQISDERLQQIRDQIDEVNRNYVGKSPFPVKQPLEPLPPTIDLPQTVENVAIPYPNFAFVQQQLTTAGLVVVSPLRKRNINGAAALENRETAIPSAVIQQWVYHHFLNRTTSSKTYVKAMFKSSLQGMLNSTNMTKSSYTTVLPTSLKSKNINIPYPPTAAAHRAAISHQIAMGNATAYNSHNVTVKIEMNANAPVDVCLGVPKINCFGNQLGKPYCLHSCASRWYNQLNVNPLHY